MESISQKFTPNFSPFLHAQIVETRDATLCSNDLEVPFTGLINGGSWTVWEIASGYDQCVNLQIAQRLFKGAFKEVIPPGLVHDHFIRANSLYFSR